MPQLDRHPTGPVLLDHREAVRVVGQAVVEGPFAFEVGERQHPLGAVVVVGAGEEGGSGGAGEGVG